MGFSLKATSTKNIWVGKFDVFDSPKFVHGISTRHGGCSGGTYQSLNLGLHVQDEATAVVSNRQAFLQSMGSDITQVVTCQQVHGSRVVAVTAEDLGKGATDFQEAIKDADALITNVPQVDLMLFFADCTPILLADPVAGAIGVAHGGWKGTAAGIVIKTVAAMTKEYGTRPENVLAGIGPAIGPCCYQVGENVEVEFQKNFPELMDQLFSRRDDKVFLNLWQANKLQLEKAGVLPANIDCAQVCTACNNSQFFSYRGDGSKTGRIAGVLGMRTRKD